MNSLGVGYRIGCKSWWRYWFNVHTYTNYLKFYHQRATRGWADCDTWDLDHYLTDVIIGSVRHLKMNQNGYPGGLSETEWDSILDKIIVGFEANKRISDSLYESELGPYPNRADLNFNDPVRQAVVKERQTLLKPLIQRDAKLFKQGMALLTEYFNYLWD